MSRFLKISFITFYFVVFYCILLLDEMHLYNSYLKKYLNIILICAIISYIYIIYLVCKNNFFSLSIIFKIIFFTLVIIIYFIIEQILLKLFMYSIGNSGGFIRNIILKDSFYQFQWYEVLYWNFLFSLYYPIYIFIFFKPFVNHLDKSIKKIRDKDK